MPRCDLLLNLGSVRLANFAPLVREKFPDLAAGHGGQTLERVREIVLWVDSISAAALDDSVDNGAAPTRVRMSDKEPPALADGRGPHVVLYAKMPIMPRRRRGG